VRGFGLGAKLRELFTRPLRDESFYEELEDALVEADLGGKVASALVERLREQVRSERVRTREDALALLRLELAGTIKTAVPAIRRGSLNVIMVLGVNGVGKTTTIAKLADHYRRVVGIPEVMLAAADTFRAAAIEQLRAWTQRLNLELVASHTGADAAAVAYDAWQAARARGRDYVIIDTAGRLHTKDNLMEELAKIRRVLQKHDPAAPRHSWLVIDGSLGSNSIEQARVFHESFGLTGLVVTKLDGTSRGGAIVGIWRELKLPIYFVGLGEAAEDLQPFSVDHYVRAVFGLGDGPD